MTYFTVSTPAILTYGFLLGLYTGGNWSLMAPMSVEILDLELSSTGLGLLMLAYGTGYLTGPPMSSMLQINIRKSKYNNSYRLDRGLYVTNSRLLCTSTEGRQNHFLLFPDAVYGVTGQYYHLFLFAGRSTGYYLNPRF